MTTYKNTSFKKVDLKNENLIVCVAEKAPSKEWIECDKDEVDKWLL